MAFRNISFSIPYSRSFFLLVEEPFRSLVEEYIIIIIDVGVGVGIYVDICTIRA